MPPALQLSPAACLTFYHGTVENIKVNVRTHVNTRTHV